MSFQKGFEYFNFSWLGEPLVQEQHFGSKGRTEGSGSFAPSSGQSPFHENRNLTYYVSRQQVNSLLVYCFTHPWEMNTKETERELFIGFKTSPVICHKKDLGYFHPSVRGRYFNIDETPFIITPQGLDLKDDQPHTLEFEIDLSKGERIIDTKGQIGGLFEITEDYGIVKLVVPIKKPSV